MSAHSPDENSPGSIATCIADALAEVSDAPTLVKIGQAVRSLRPLATTQPLVPVRLACLGSFTMNSLADALFLAGMGAGMNIDSYIAPYGQFDRELIDPSSGLSASNPTVVLLAVRLPDVCSALYDDFASLNEGTANRLVDDWIVRLASAIRTFRARSAAPILMLDYESPIVPALGAADRTATPSQVAVIARANDELRRVASEVPNVRVMEYDALIARHGRRTWADARLAAYARIPIAAINYFAFARFVVSHLRPLLGLSKKVLVLDADHTLWGGVIGDVGSAGIALGPDYPGNCFVAFQKRILDLHRRGVVLCLASKNEESVVLDVLRNHPSMVLREQHFAALRVNWDPKPGNVAQMARDLNLGLDSFVFLDDSPVECQMMRQALPDVLSICLPKEPAELSGVIDSLDCFEQFSISEEDRQRGAMYRAESGRRTLEAEAVDLPTFYRRLEMVMTVSVDNPMDAHRAAQMAARTNQFNMNTVRHSEDDIRRFIASERHHVITLALADRFGDNGVVGLAIVEKIPGEWALNTLLMSCRVLGRTVEQGFIKWIAARAGSCGAERLTGLFAPTTKNKPFAPFYGSCGFERQAGTTPERWTLTLRTADTNVPDWLRIVVTEGAANA